jgi:hypothetical protein
LYAPNAARLVLYTECTLQATDAQQCDCNFSNLPADQQANFPEKQKEIQQQTDWKYLINQKQEYAASFINNAKQYTGCVDSLYSFLLINSIFHPPCSLYNIS